MHIFLNYFKLCLSIPFSTFPKKTHVCRLCTRLFLIAHFWVTFIIYGCLKWLEFSRLLLIIKYRWRTGWNWFICIIIRKFQYLLSKLNSTKNNYKYSHHSKSCSTGKKVASRHSLVHHKALYYSCDLWLWHFIAKTVAKTKSTQGAKSVAADCTRQPLHYHKTLDLKTLFLVQKHALTPTNTQCNT